jgi:hypothetical protein
MVEMTVFVCVCMYLCIRVYSDEARTGEHGPGMVEMTERGGIAGDAGAGSDVEVVFFKMENNK